MARHGGVVFVVFFFRHLKTGRGLGAGVVVELGAFVGLLV